MSKNTIDNFFNDAVADHEWLDAKDKVNAPFSDYSSYNKLPELAFQEMPQPLHKDFVKVKEANIEKIGNDVKRQIMLGKSLTHIKESIIDNLPESIKVSAYHKLTKIAEEFPLLGTVYIDPSAFGQNAKSCVNGANTLNQKNSSRLAIFAKKMASCGGCSYNQGGTCRLYKKSLVEEIPYTEKTFNHYRNHLVVANKIASSKQISSKEELKEALQFVNKTRKESSSVVYHNESKRTSVSKTSSQNFESKEKLDISKDLSLKLASGIEASLFKNYVTTKYSSEYQKYPEVFSKYAGFIGSMGRIFIELSAFNSLSDAKNFINRHASKVPFVLSDNKKNYTDLDEKFLGKKIISSLKDIPVKYWESNLKGFSFNQNDLKTNPLAVTKKAFLKTENIKTASKVDTFDMEKEIDINGFDPKNKVSETKVQSKIKQEREIKSSKPIPAEGFKKSATAPVESIKVENNKVKVQIDKSLEVEMESTDFDQSISKYL
jgi:anthranilate/para-aminobenzoate synthase component II